MQTTDDFYKKEYSFGQRFNLGFALESLAKAMRCARAYEVDMEVAKGMRYLIEFINDVKPCPKMSVKAAEFSSNAHTYLRKYCDDAITTMLYNLVARGTGYGVWVAFCESVCKEAKNKNFDFREVFSDFKSYYDENDENPDNLIMRFALEAWGEKDISRMVKTMKEEWGMFKE